MEEVLKRVEEVLSTLKSGVTFVKELSAGSRETRYVCFGNFHLQVYGIHYEAGIAVCVGIDAEGDVYIDKVGEESINGHRFMHRTKEIALMMAASGMSQRQAEKAVEAIVDLQSLNQEMLYDAVTEEFETRLPDLCICDRIYPSMH